MCTKFFFIEPFKIFQLAQNMEIICKIVESFTLDCNLYVYSQTEKNSILIDYGDCQPPELLNITSLYFEHFGLNVPSLSTNSIVYSTSSFYLSLNNEFKFTANLVGFELFTNQSGTIDLSVKINLKTK